MRYRRAVERLRILAEACEGAKKWPPDGPFLREAVAGYLDLLDATGEPPR
jgi:hypothetical protein